jgi:guanylate kinase
MMPSDAAGFSGSAVEPPDPTNGRLFILSAPSGAGKTTLCNALRRRFKELFYSISYTTRPPRSGEKNGREYFFITHEEFEQGIQSRRWAEWAMVHGHYYGTSAQWIETALTSGKSVLMDIDVQGARQIKQRFPKAVSIFIMPPSIEELETRLRLRGKDNNDVIALRMQNARNEIAQKDAYDYIVVNDDLDKAICELIELVKQAGRRITG